MSTANQSSSDQGQPCHNQQLLARIDMVVQLAHRLGRSPDGGRLAAYVRKVRPTVVAWIENHSNAAIVDAEFVHAFTELTTLSHIAETLDVLVSRSPKFETRVSKLIEDTFYSERGRPTAGKDTQAETVAGSFLEWAGFLPVWREAGPDWEITLGAEKALVEVKRIHADNAIDSAIRRGVRQLREHAGQGILWLDLSELLTPKAHTWKVFYGADSGRELAPELYSVAERLKPKLDRRLDRSVVDAVVFYAKCAVQQCPSFEFLAEQMRAQNMSPSTPADVAAFRNDLDTRGKLPMVGFGTCDLLFYDLFRHEPRLTALRSLAIRLTDAARKHALG